MSLIGQGRQARLDRLLAAVDLTPSREPLVVASSRSRAGLVAFSAFFWFVAGTTMAFDPRVGVLAGFVAAVAVDRAARP